MCTISMSLNRRVLLYVGEWQEKIRLITFYVSCNNIRFCSEEKYYEPFDQIKYGTLKTYDNLVIHGLNIP